MKFAAAAISPEAARAKLLSHAIRLRRVGSTWASLAFFKCGVMRAFPQLVLVSPEHLVFGVLEVLEIVALDGEDEQTHSGQAHNDGCRNRNPGSVSAVQSLANSCTGYANWST